MIHPLHRNAALIAAAAAVASTIIVRWHASPLLAAVGMALVMIVLLIRFHETRDLVGLAIGATVGNVIELACDAAGIWQHADRSVLGLAPPYILLCYPILGLAMPRLIDAIAGEPRPEKCRDRDVVPIAFALLASFVALSLRFGRESLEQAVVCALLLSLTLWRFHSRRDITTAVVGAIVSLTWEIPATMAGAWSFPRPDAFNLIPAWLPAAYAVFFVTMGRITAALAAESEAAIASWRSQPWTNERRRDLVIVSALIVGAVAGVCTLFSMPIACALASALVLAIGLYRWHTSGDVAIAIVGAAFGPILEYQATAAQLWIYPFTTIGLMPAWVFTLWPAFPLCLVRLTHTLWPPGPRAEQPALQAIVGLAILVVEIPLLATFGNTRPMFTTGMTTAMLFTAAVTLRSPQAVLMLALSGGFGMLCEMLPIALGAWIYPVDGPLPFPLWLPTGYALFGFGIVQLAQGLDRLRHRAGAPARERQPELNQRGAKHAIAGR